MGLSVYITHVAVQIITIGSRKYPWYFGNMELINDFFGDFVATIMISTLTYLSIEAPVLLVEKYFYSLRHSNQTNKKFIDEELTKTNLKWYQRLT
jgi:hypothetical protein